MSPRNACRCLSLFAPVPCQLAGGYYTGQTIQAAHDISVRPAILRFDFCDLGANGDTDSRVVVAVRGSIEKCVFGKRSKSVFDSLDGR